VILFILSYLFIGALGTIMYAKHNNHSVNVGSLIFFASIWPVIAFVGTLSAFFDSPIWAKEIIKKKEDK